VLIRLDHVQVAVADLDLAVAAYTELLGLEPAWRGENPGGGSASATFRLGNTSIVLVCETGAGPIGHLVRRHLQEQGEGLLALAFATDDATACARELNERGLRAGEPVEATDRHVESGALRRWKAVPLGTRSARGVRLFAVEYLENPLEPGPFLAPRDSRISGLDHVVVQSPDPEATLGVYGAGLGLRLALDQSFESRGVRLIFFRLAGITLEVAAQLDRPAEPNATDRLWGLAYQVNDVRAARKRLAENPAFDVSEVRRGHKPGTSVCSVRGNTHGVATLLIGPDS
jgi:catechol 2,3-dioxygenase-like lactoylglutathione lyase family enzyme